jgi:sugar lactone lactonase YvrE
MPFQHPLILCVLVAIALWSETSHTERPQPVNDLPNPYRAVENYFKLAEGRWWESTSAVDIDIDGRSIWVADRCAANSCAGSKLNPILKFDQSGTLLRRFGAGMFILPHGIHVDRDGNVWVTDARAPSDAEVAQFPDQKSKGHVVYKFSPAGTVLLTLGKAGVAGDGTDGLLNGPSDVITAPNGDVFVADGDGSDDASASPTNVARIVKFTKDGTFVKWWGSVGGRRGKLRAPHGLALDSRGRLFVADRGNNRIQIFDQGGAVLEEWKQFGRPSGLFIDASDTLYVADSESSDTTNPGWRRGIRIGSARDGTVTLFIPQQSTEPGQPRSGAEGVAADAMGNVYGAEVGAGAQALRKYVLTPGVRDGGHTPVSERWR